MYVHVCNICMSAIWLLYILQVIKKFYGLKKGEYRDCTKTNGASVGCKCSTELVFGMIVCSVKLVMIVCNVR